MANWWHKGGRGGRKVANGCYMVRIPFLCYTKQGNGERVTTKEQKKETANGEKGKKKEKAGGLF